MKESTRTIIFGATALTSAALAVGVHFWTQPASPKAFALVGEPFYPQFDDPADAKALEVIAWDETNQKAAEFRVEFSPGKGEKPGIWRIPTHHNYPAEAAERLAKTASSVIGVTREAVVGRREEQHERFGVVDPLGENVEDGTGVGRRIRLLDGDDVLTDLIVGKRVEEGETEADAEKEQERDLPIYYVRRPDEKETFKARIHLDVSTKFADWIEPDLLKAEGSRWVAFKTQRFGFRQNVQDRGAVKLIGPKEPDPSKDETASLTTQGFGGWQLKDLKDETHNLKFQAVQAIEQTLPKLKIVGVRPRPQFDGQPILDADLNIILPENRSQVRALQSALGDLAGDMESKGFILLRASVRPDGVPVLKLVSAHGRLTAATNQGIEYILDFGEIVVGSERDIQVGEPAENGNAKTGSQPDAKNPAKKPDSKPDAATAKNRYLYVRVRFDEKHLGEVPVEPTEPAVPAPRPGADAKPLVAARPDASGDSRRKSVQEVYEEARRDYDSDKSQYDRNLKDYNDRAKAGRLKVAELSERFADWFYVISSDNLDELRPRFENLIEKKPDPPAIRAPRP